MNRSYTKGTLLFFSFIAIFFTVSCGKRKPPLPPIENVPQRTERLGGYQQGNQIILTLPALQRNAGDQSIQSIRRIDVYRLAESPNAPLPLTEDEFSARSVLIGSIKYSELLQSTGNITYIDTSAQNIELVRFRYAIKFINASGSRAPFSNFLLIEPTLNVALPPTELNIEESENSIKIDWTPPKQNIDSSTPANLLGFNVYRVSANQDAAKVMDSTPLNPKPVISGSFSDSSFQFGEIYRYFIRTVSLGSDGNPVESTNSKDILVSPKDTYPPSSPTAISIAASSGKLSIFFPSNPEKDVVGYYIFRSNDPNTPLKNWTKVTPELLTRTTFQDPNIEVTKRYYYYIVAVDKYGNESKPSEIISEIVP
jgi:fibronectin type 3 domain-containing protein